MFCKKPLESNEVVETFSVGRRLAFDAAKGRLWVVCRTCQRWNLTPLEERWEAVETCEKLFRGTRIRTSSENIGLARHPEGLELVRIGKPLRPEFAAWRYGDQFGRRRRRTMVYSIGMIAGSVAGWALMGRHWKHRGSHGNEHLVLRRHVAALPSLDTFSAFRWPGARDESADCRSYPDPAARRRGRLPGRCAARHSQTPGDRVVRG